MKKQIHLLLSFCILGVATHAASDSSTPIEDWVPLKVGTEDGRGPLALTNVNHRLMGTANVYGGAQPDLFLAGYGGSRAVWLARWSGFGPQGQPVFEKPVEVRAPFNQKAYIFQTADGTIRAFWIDKGLVIGVFDKDSMNFRKTREIPLTGLPRTPESLSVLENPDGSLDLIFEISDGQAGREGDPWSDEWRPYDAAGIWTGNHPYRHLYAARLSGLNATALESVRQASSTNREVYLNMYQTTPVRLREGKAKDWMSGSRMGNIYFFPRTSDRSDVPGFERRIPVQGSQGVAVRTPMCSTSVIAYPDAKTGKSNLIAAGEGALQFYRFTGSFNQAGAPVYEGPWPVLQEKADLYAGSLPVPSVVDWDGDGHLDIVAGNSEGTVLFFRNLGNDSDPRFANGAAVHAGGRPIHVQAGYSGSVQGVGEARWGYLSPNVTDWNGDGLPDIVMGDITGNYTVYINKGTKTAPELEPAAPLYSDGLDLHGQWRVRPAVARIGDRTALVIVDDDDHFHLYWRIDDQNVESAGKLKLTDGSLISASSGHGGMKGRCKLSFFDWDGDGLLDLIVSTSRHNAIPNTTTGYPKPKLGNRPQGVVMLLRNAGTNEAPIYEHPVPFVHRMKGILHPGGAHESGSVATNLGGDGINLLAGNEIGRFMLLRRENLNTEKPQSEKPSL